MTARTTSTSDTAPVALTVALVIVTIQTLAESAFVIARDDYGPGGKGLVVGMLGLKIFFAARARRLRAGAVLGLLMFELVGILVALGADWHMGLRLGLVATVVTVFSLVLSSLHAFPTPELP